MTSFSIRKLFPEMADKSTICPKGRAVIITGCDTGFGNGLAFQLNRLGFHTIALCLNANSDGVIQLAQKAVFAHQLHAIEVDITNDTQIDVTFEQISDILRLNNLKLWAVVNNAGVFHAGFAEWGEGVDAYRRTLDVNTLGAIRVTRKCLPLLRQSGGRVVNVLSFASRLAIDGYSAYCVSKYALLAFNDSLRREMFRFGVKVISVEPSCYRTPIAQLEAVNQMQDRVWSETSPSVREDQNEVIDALIRAVVSDEPNVRYQCSGILDALIVSFAELLPIPIFDSFWRFVYRFEVFSK
ncbi:unnamed protein product [Medioppia subpectinata]|uniref:Uncharacterized protein n=1 Tax=Medioppia subpectinata TaxID=1979941 RepID=A0A7R9Q449_9ACAR|nr:unnamed protein product [Medioppia subpectinata]CAG2111151.1 unnamed protein product [Medioppia subpectinata]